MKIAIVILLCGWGFTLLAFSDTERRADQCHVAVQGEVFP